MKKGIIFVLLLTSIFYVSAQSTGKYQIKFLEINKKNSDYGVAILDENKLMFSSAEERVTTARKNYNPKKDLFVGDIDFDGEIKNIKPVINDPKFNQVINGVAYTSNKKTVYFSRNRYAKKLSKQKLAKNQRLELFKATVEEDGSWSNVERLSINKKGYSSGFPVLNSDNTKLYFVSDRLPSEGKTDIFVVDILKKGKYGKPKNLGKNVNTPGTETTPFITEEGILYFSSDGHPGKGKLDVFAVEVYDNTTSEIYQLASPVNSINDDFAYIVNKDNNQGFFTSNRLQGAGFNDIYAFTLEEDIRPGECFITVDGKVRDKDSFEIISGATVDLYNLEGNLLQSVSTYDDGTYKFTVSCAKEYKLIASNENYKNDEKRIEILEENYHSALHTNLLLSKIPSDKPVIERLQPIYYDFDDATITNAAAKEMDKIVTIMQNNPDLIIEASSFTDSRGTDTYNINLSKRRARSAVAYLKAQGIDAQRIKAKGYGEEKLINQCVNGVECDERAHQMNRRTEFNFANIQASNNKKKKQLNRKTRIVDKVPKPEKEKVPEAITKKEKEPDINRVVEAKPKPETKEKKSENVDQNLNQVSEVKKAIKVEKSNKKAVKEEVIINYNSSIVATNKESNKALNYIENEKFKVIDKLLALEKKYELAITDYVHVSDSLRIERDKITKVIESAENMEETGWSNIIGYKNDLIAFNKRYKELISINDQKYSSYNPLNRKKSYYADADNKTVNDDENLISSIDKQDLAIMEENLRIDNVEITAMKMGIKGKYQKTNNAKKTELIKVSFKLVHNEKVASGQKEAHIVLQNPEGKVTQAKGIFKLKDTKVEKKYTDRAVISYNKNDVDVIMYIQRKGKSFEKGVYPVKLFLEGQLMAVSNLNLQNSY